MQEQSRNLLNSTESCFQYELDIPILARGVHINEDLPQMHQEEKHEDTEWSNSINSVWNITNTTISDAMMADILNNIDLLKYDEDSFSRRQLQRERNEELAKEEAIEHIKQMELEAYASAWNSAHAKNNAHASNVLLSNPTWISNDPAHYVYIEPNSEAEMYDKLTETYTNEFFKDCFEEVDEEEEAKEAKEAKEAADALTAAVASLAKVVENLELPSYLPKKLARQSECDIIPNIDSFDL
jgi:hypothetical protein